MANENGDSYLMMVLFGHSDWREGLAENGGLSGDEVRKTFDSDPDFAEVFDPVSDFVRKVSENRFQPIGNRFDTTWNEPIGAAVQKKFRVGGELLGKSEVTSRMLSVLNKVREFCNGDEARQIERAIRCLDFSLFGELCEPVLDRMRQAIR